MSYPFWNAFIDEIWSFSYKVIVRTAPNNIQKSEKATDPDFVARNRHLLKQDAKQTVEIGESWFNRLVVRSEGSIRRASYQAFEGVRFLAKAIRQKLPDEDISPLKLKASDIIWKLTFYTAIIRTKKPLPKEWPTRPTDDELRIPEKRAIEMDRIKYESKELEREVDNLPDKINYLEERADFLQWRYSALVEDLGRLRTLNKDPEIQTWVNDIENSLIKSQKKYGTPEAVREAGNPLSTTGRQGTSPNSESSTGSSGDSSNTRRKDDFDDDDDNDLLSQMARAQEARKQDTQDRSTTHQQGQIRKAQSSLAGTRIMLEKVKPVRSPVQEFPKRRMSKTLVEEPHSTNDKFSTGNELGQNTRKKNGFDDDDDDGFGDDLLAQMARAQKAREQDARAKSTIHQQGQIRKAQSSLAKTHFRLEEVKPVLSPVKPAKVKWAAKIRNKLRRMFGKRTSKERP
ncbi:hypothetical protein BJ684DRAFT_15583 [Piptocephalis cylindrospora]|uniref:Uncharacterized protein n=1 Tax=Piptocephalis cylindrospora TaxID=1907219 RepID=A0A4P9Y565_9FUNG|nr:hypothetical protein BJ684DRAFT_15583 [Piptocephalis cylindrospora]|eukprot:RKP14075.1 hypothetical protein BJ684DRAFT_15583 [Piptocephalis cylindrospora]